MSLTDAKIRSLKPSNKPYKGFNGGGLYLLVKPNGSKLWRYKYRFKGKENIFSFGAYPNISLKAARGKHADARRLLEDGTDPNYEKRKHQFDDTFSDKTFQQVMEEWLDTKRGGWRVTTLKKKLQIIEKDLLPVFGKQPIDSLTPKEVVIQLKKIESRGAIETAKRAKLILSQILRYAVATGRAERDFTVDLNDALIKRKVKHRAAVLDPVRVGEILNLFEETSSGITVKNAMKLSPLVFVRPGELRKAEWSEIDFENRLWIIPDEKMKQDESLIVPLSEQAIAILKEQYQYTHKSRYVFPQSKDFKMPMSEGAIKPALRKLGISNEELVPHGFRAMARTLLAEKLDIRPDLIEMQLAHIVRDTNGRAYNRTTFLEKRRVIMQTWADYLDDLRLANTQVVTRLKAPF